MQNRNAGMGTDNEVVGLFYGGFVLIGLSIGTFAGFMVGGGREEFLTTGWVETLIGTATGLLLGVGAGLISHGVFAYKNRKSTYKL
ncbi:MAG: hypothetical protein FWB85_08045 [Chitinispirillia bacterium]|nr:hypothetical protein [Chitinispirillia bacterium]MCL2242211.1 hypothetical protein [Chitinispirillia bacterium]